MTEYNDIPWIDEKPPTMKDIVDVTKDFYDNLTYYIICYDPNGDLFIFNLKNNEYLEREITIFRIYYNNVKVIKDDIYNLGLRFIIGNHFHERNKIFKLKSKSFISFAKEFKKNKNSMRIEWVCNLNKNKVTFFDRLISIFNIYK